MSVTVEKVKADGSSEVFVTQGASDGLDKFRGVSQERAVLQIEELRKADPWQKQQVSCWQPKNRLVASAEQSAKGWL